jgi:hypothetical protein
MPHRIHRNGYDEAALLDPACDECCDKRVSDLDDDHVLALLGIDPELFRGLTDPSGQGWQGDVSTLDSSVAARSILWAFRYAIRDANALQVGREVRELQRQGRWPFVVVDLR